MTNKMKKCKTCGTDVSKSAETCPKCGARLKRKMGCLGKSIITVLVFAAFGVVAVLISQTENQQSPVEKEVIPISDLDFESLDEIYSLSSAYTDLQKDEEWEKYQGKKIQWSGEVSAIGETLGTVTLQVKMKPDTFTSDLLIRLKDEEREKALKLKEGDNVTFIGILSDWGTVLPITLSDGEIIIN